MTVLRAISGFRCDDSGDWIAELGCGHTQHVRHNPPWQSREWVLTETGRAAFVGRELACPKCAAGAAQTEGTPH
jgi:hypothetical protein